MSDSTQKTASQEDRAALARGIMSILDKWGLSASEQVELLNLPDKTPTRMLRRRFRIHRKSMNVWSILLA